MIVAKMMVVMMVVLVVMAMIMILQAGVVQWLPGLAQHFGSAHMPCGGGRPGAVTLVCTALPLVMIMAARLVRTLR